MGFIQQPPPHSSEIRVKNTLSEVRLPDDFFLPINHSGTVHNLVVLYLWISVCGLIIMMDQNPGMEPVVWSYTTSKFCIWHIVNSMHILIA